MSFFLVDDGFAMHEKVRQILECDRADKHGSRFVALSLWLLAGSFCSRKSRDKSDGVITAAQAKMVLNCDTKTAFKACEKLVEVGLWTRQCDAYRFHEWENWQRPRPRPSTTDDARPPLGQTSDEARTESGQSEDNAQTSHGQRADDARTDLGHGPSTIPNSSEPSSRARVPSSSSSPTSSSSERERALGGEESHVEIVAPLHSADPLVPLRMHLVQGFRARYEKRRGLMWHGHQSNPEPTPTVRLLAHAAGAHGRRFEDVADHILDSWFAEEWPANNDFPWRTFCKQVSKYIPNAPSAEAS